MEDLSSFSLEELQNLLDKVHDRKIISMLEFSRKMKSHTDSINRCLDDLLENSLVSYGRKQPVNVIIDKQIVIGKELSNPIQEESLSFQIEFDTLTKEFDAIQKEMNKRS